MITVIRLPDAAAVTSLRALIDLPRGPGFELGEFAKDERSIVLAFYDGLSLVGTIRFTPLAIRGCAEVSRLVLDPTRNPRVTLSDCFVACGEYMALYHPELVIGLAWCLAPMVRVYERCGWRTSAGTRTAFIDGRDYWLMQGTVADIMNRGAK